MTPWPDFSCIHRPKPPESRGKFVCKKGKFLNNGKAGNIDNINTIVTEYNSQYENDNTSHIDFKDSKKNEFVFIRSLTIKNENKINQLFMQLTFKTKSNSQKITLEELNTFETFININKVK